jgi:hypothetical protein
MNKEFPSGGIVPVEKKGGNLEDETNIWTEIQKDPLKYVNEHKELVVPQDKLELGTWQRFRKILNQGFIAEKHYIMYFVDESGNINSLKLNYKVIRDVRKFKDMLNAQGLKIEIDPIGSDLQSRILDAIEAYESKKEYLEKHGDYNHAEFVKKEARKRLLREKYGAKLKEIRAKRK